MLADKKEEYIDALYKEMVASGIPHPTKDLGQFKKELAEIREQGYSLNVGKLSTENYSLAVPVYDANNVVVCAIAIIAPISRMSDAKTKKFLEILFDAAKEASDRLTFAE